MKHVNLLAPMLALLFVGSAMAAPLDPAHLPENAKWVVHVDFEQWQETVLAKKLEKNRPEMVKRARTWLSEQYGIDPQEDLHGLTLFSDTYETHTGTAILFADYDQDKAVSKLEEKKDKLKKSSWEGHTLYTKKQDKHGKQGTVILLDGKAVIASSPERAKAAVKLLQGDSESLKGKDSPLTGKAPTGSVVYGAAIDLKQIEKHDGVFPILQQHEQVVYAVGNDGDEVFEQIELTAASEETAQEMKKVVDGLVSLGRVWAADDEALKKVMKDVKVNRDGKVVTSSYRGSTDDVSAALSAFGQRWQQWKQLKKK